MLAHHNRKRLSSQFIYRLKLCRFLAILLTNVVFTPHIGAETIEAQKRIGLETVKIVKRFISKLKIKRK